RGSPERGQSAPKDSRALREVLALRARARCRTGVVAEILGGVRAHGGRPGTELPPDVVQRRRFQRDPYGRVHCRRGERAVAVDCIFFGGTGIELGGRRIFGWRRRWRWRGRLVR